ncbi:hypothetical protein EJ03DRAFT_220013 [Teratosphaeria nubilosa]|uniref:Uncharacterized protein n=1 Tax=Teratosphaeria nubilosa TaxID=161662 RepID=A0A6G1KYF9_9PEZI|nr:hypothetical protein EJ03DRAFT_220013 [Teratosphaeria nubilosa]
MASLDFCRQQLAAAQHEERVWQAESDALTTKCRALENAKASAEQIYSDLVNAHRNSPYAELQNWHHVVANAGHYYQHCCYNLDLFISKIQWANTKLQANRASAKHAENLLAAAERREREKEESRERLRLAQEAQGRERIQEGIRNQQAKKEGQKHITVQEVKSFRQQATEVFKSYAALTTFPDPPSEPCTQAACQIAARALKACQCNVRKCFMGLGVRELKVERGKWHPDRFVKCQGGRAVVEELQRKAREAFVVVEAMYQEAVERERIW